MKGNLLRLLKICLANRAFKVRIGPTLSDLFVQENSFPQESGLCVTLFLIAINGIADGVPHDIEKNIICRWFEYHRKGN